ncbi:uncharacterized protein BX664DRAFT_244056, partial [Halteromyces radiatus]|uniref:uncharacterized protein n=1 Tax=Halteromyces radiatus TaxID=101107 RepID=UPI00221E9507
SMSSSSSPSTTSLEDVQEERIQVESFAQLVAAHWQFDHLDSIMSTSHKEMADLIQNHIEIDLILQPSDGTSIASDSSLTSSSNVQQRPFMRQRPMEHMEFDLLKSQMMNAIQSRTQGLLPEMWDHLGEALGRPAMEAYIQQQLRLSCPTIDNNDSVTLDCLQENASMLTLELDTYVQQHLMDLWIRLQEEALPDLLDSTVKELEELVAYFNQDAVFTTHHHISLNVIPWS